MDHRKSDDNTTDNESIGECSDEFSSMLSSGSESDDSEYALSTDYNMNSLNISNYGTSLDSEAHIENSGNELIKNKNSELEYLESLEKYPDFKIEGPEITKNLQSIEDNVDSNRLSEDKKGIQIPLVGGERPQYKRNAETSKSVNSIEITNRINPAHPAGPKGDVFTSVTEPNMTLDEAVAGEIDDISNTRVLQETPYDSLSQFIINSDGHIVKTTYVDDAKSVTLTTKGDSTLQDSLTDDSNSLDEMAAHLAMVLFMVLLASYQRMIAAGCGDEDVENREEDGQNRACQSGYQSKMVEYASFYSTMEKKLRIHVHLKPASKTIPEWRTFLKKYSDGFSKKFTESLQTQHLGNIEQIVAMAHLNVNKLSEDGNGEDDSGDEEEGSDHENASDNINIGEVQQNGAMNDHRPCQSLVAECSQSHVVECYEAVDTGSLSELVGLQSTTTSQLHNEWIADDIKSLLSLLFNSGGQITSVLPTIVTIDINGQKIVLTSDPAFYQKCLHNSKSVGPPDSVAVWRDYLTALGVHSTTMIIDNDAPTIVGLLLLPTSVNSNILGDTAAELVRRNQKDAFISKIQRRFNNNDDSEDVTMVASRDPESNHSTKEDTVVVRNNPEVNCAGRQVSSAPVENVMPLFHSASASANENQEKLITVNPNMELRDLIERLVPPQLQELRCLIYRLLQEDPEFYNLFVQMSRRQTRVQLVESWTAEALPTTYIQGVGVASILHDGSDPDHEKFSTTYNMPYYFSPPPCGEPFSLPSLSINDNATNSPYPVNCVAVPASDDPSDPSDSQHEQENASLLCGGSGQESLLYQPPDSIQQLISGCHGLRNVIEELLEQDPEFHNHFIQMMSQQYQPCVVHSLPVINMGVVGGMAFLCDGSDGDPEQWSKAYKQPGNFPPPPCGEPNLPKPSLDSNDDYPYNVNCEPHPCSDGIGQVLSSGSELESKDHYRTSGSNSDG